jgi:hypothetical protein
MIRHVVMWNTVARDEAGHAAQVAEIKARLEALPAVVPGVERFEVGVNELPGDNGADVILISEFADWPALKEYAVHPEHVKTSDRIREITQSRKSVDYML